MRKKMKKYLVIMAFGVLITGMKTDKIMAQDLAETAETMEQEKEDISTADYVENGIVILENRGNFGSVDLTYADNHYTIKCDYSEYEIPMGTLCRLEIHPLSGYQVDFVKVNQNPVYAENEVYEILMMEGFIEISIGYTQTEEMQSSTINETFKDDRVSDRAKNSVSAVSHEVKVTYLNEEKKNVIPEENTAEVMGSAVGQAGESERVDEVLAEEMAVDVNEAVRNFEEPAEKEVAEKEPAEEEMAEKKQNAEETESEKAEDKKPAVLEQENEVEENEEETEMEESVKTEASHIVSEIEGKSSKIPAKETTQIKKKSVLNISNFPLYLLIICCILIVRYMKKMDKKGRGING